VKRILTQLQKRTSQVYALVFILMILGGVSMFFLAQSGLIIGLSIVLGILILTNLLIILI
jgi:hypothetical protein